MQFYSLLSGKGNAAQFSKSCGPIAMAFAVLRTYGSAFNGVATAIKKRKTILSRKRWTASEYHTLLNKFQISAKELILKE